jgi:hypothetical protein
MQVDVPFTIMVVCMHMPTLSDQSHPEYPAKEYKHGADAELSCQREGFRNRHAEHQDSRADQQ